MSDVYAMNRFEFNCEWTSTMELFPTSSSFFFFKHEDRNSVINSSNFPISSEKNIQVLFALSKSSSEKKRMFICLNEQRQTVVQKFTWPKRQSTAYTRLAHAPCTLYKHTNTQIPARTHTWASSNRVCTSASVFVCQKCQIVWHFLCTKHIFNTTTTNSFFVHV